MAACRIYMLPFVTVNRTADLFTRFCLLRERWVPIQRDIRPETFGVGTREGGDVAGQTGFVAVEIRNKKEG